MKSRICITCCTWVIATIIFAILTSCSSSSDPLNIININEKSLIERYGDIYPSSNLGFKEYDYIELGLVVLLNGDKVVQYTIYQDIIGKDVLPFRKGQDLDKLISIYGDIVDLGRELSSDEKPKTKVIYNYKDNTRRVFVDPYTLVYLNNSNRVNKITFYRVAKGSVREY